MQKLLALMQTKGCDGQGYPIGTKLLEHIGFELTLMKNRLKVGKWVMISNVHKIFIKTFSEECGGILRIWEGVYYELCILR